MNGRALARNGTVTLINDSITVATCAAPSPTGSPAVGPTVPPTDSLATTGDRRSDLIPFVAVMAFLVALVIVASRWSSGATRRR
jgi:hypothetical protein